MLEFGRQAVPDVSGSVRHSSSHCPAIEISSVKADSVSLVWPVGRAGARLVANKGIRKAIYSR